ncbi:MAG: DUF1223 domain-containing protein [Rhodospirillaceae bacterium]
MKLFAGLFAAAVLALPAAAADTPLTVVELYTSQGCSSCPPADRLAGELSKRPDVLPLSLHVSYWDYIGWKDPFARDDHAERQRLYSRRFNLRYVYTPQMVIDGAYQASGGNAGEIYTFIEKAKALPHVPVALSRDDGVMVAALPEHAVDGAVEVIAVFADDRHDTVIQRGENGGRTLSYHNVVRGIQVIGTWKGEKAKIAVPVSDAGGDFCAVILQEPASRRILGAARMALAASR